MQKVTLEAISKGKSGEGKKGPWQLIGIKTQEFGDTWINGFENDTTKTWKKGDSISLDIYDEEYNGKTYKKFKSPNATNALASDVEKLKTQMAYIVKHLGLGNKDPLPNPVQTSHNVTEQPKMSDDPFDSFDLNDDSKVPF